MKKVLIFITSLVLFLFLGANRSLVQGSQIQNPALSGNIRDLRGTEFLSLLLPNLITVFFIAATLIGFIFLIIGGIKWITSGDNQEAATKAKGTLTAAIIGLVLVFLAYAVLNLIGFFFHLNLININIAPLILGE